MSLALVRNRTASTVRLMMGIYDGHVPMHGKERALIFP
jgi:hypothetical protein